MSSDFVGIEAITFDFFHTLVYHREGKGRGRLVVEYLREQGLRPARWEHRFLYDIFENHDTCYSPDASSDAKNEHHARLTHRVLRCVGISSSDVDVPRHAPAMWRILGPACLAVYPDVVETLRTLRFRGYRLALISNWHHGLRHFCFELGLLEFFDPILSSADLGVAKPDARIFSEACTRLGIPAQRILHVGDSLTDDYLGGEEAGHSVVLVDRKQGSGARAGTRVIHSLNELPEMLAS